MRISSDNASTIVGDSGADGSSTTNPFEKLLEEANSLIADVKALEVREGIDRDIMDVCICFDLHFWSDSDQNVDIIDYSTLVMLCY